MLTRDEATARVAKGAAHLDQVRPGWFRQIDVGRLDLQSDCLCVLGQVVGTFRAAPVSLRHELNVDDAGTPGDLTGGILNRE